MRYTAALLSAADLNVEIGAFFCGLPAREAAFSLAWTGKFVNKI